VAKILNLRDSRIRSFVRAGFLSPSRGQKRTLQFTFQDVLFLKAAKGLLDSRVPAKRVVRMLASLKRQLANDRHLASVKIYADGKRVIVLDGKSRWQPDSGQFLLDFESRGKPRNLRFPRRRAAKSEEQVSAVEWFNRGLELEASSAEAAQRAYHRALEIDPRMTAAHVNLGKLYHEARQAAKAESHYRAAVASAPDDPLPLFNLGVLLEDFKQPAQALEAYRAALKLDPNFGDAHYNLGLLLEKMGALSEALLHLRTARKIYLGK
jgi:tetratricopeptide (TPR) repeat protein